MRYINIKTYRIQKAVCVILSVCAACLLCYVLCDCEEIRAQRAIDKTQEKLAKEVLRFHVLANSDSNEDQKVKRQVRDAVLVYRSRLLNSDGNKDTSADADSMEQEVSRAEAERLAREYLPEFEQEVNRVLKKAGVNYRAKAVLADVYFPEKYYGNICFPKGWYRALEIRLGKATGHNWWCVLYPSMCFTEAVCVTPDEKGRENLREMLDADAYELVTKPEKFRLKSYFFGEKLNRWLADR